MSLRGGRSPTKQSYLTCKQLIAKKHEMAHLPRTSGAGSSLKNAPRNDIYMCLKQKKRQPTAAAFQDENWTGLLLCLGGLCFGRFCFCFGRGSRGGRGGGKRLHQAALTAGSIVLVDHAFFGG